VDRVPPSRDHSAAACSSLGCDRGFPAKFPSHRRQIVGRCTCPNFYRQRRRLDISSLVRAQCVLRGYRGFFVEMKV
jgi:hypothetical protein